MWSSETKLSCIKTELKRCTLTESLINNKYYIIIVFNYYNYIIIIIFIIHFYLSGTDVGYIHFS